MRGQKALTILALAATTAILSGLPAHAANPCEAVFNALTKVVTTPSHSYTTITSVNGNTTEAETIFANGQKYIRARGKWMRLPVTSQDVVEQEKEKEQQGKSACQVVKDESVNGESATVYSVHRDYGEVEEDGKLWISKKSGLLLRAEEDIDNRGNKVKEHRSTRFEYGNVQAPL